jgi:2,3-bisphosphoglycerate-independent phosphoglycerate mutase
MNVTNENPRRPVLLVIMDGVGVTPSTFGNAVRLASMPQLEDLARIGLYTELFAHGTYVGMPSNSDLGNSEVGHNALGAGRIFDQGAKLVQESIEAGSLFKGKTWLSLIDNTKAENSTLHFIGLLSDGNVHSHEDHLHAMLRQAKFSGIRKARVHILLDGRDVGEKSAEIYIGRLNKLLSELADHSFDVKVASGGGRMTTTMDRYEADWGMVERGWQAHVLGNAPLKFKSIDAAIHYFRTETKLTDQNIPHFVIEENGQPVGAVVDGDSVIFFNFRGDRAIEISRAFTDVHFQKFNRIRWPKVQYAGMMEYDGDLKIPNQYLVVPPAIDKTMGEYLCSLGLRQFACSETQKFGHVTYFWNGNRSGYFDERLEEYCEVRSDEGITFDKRPWMKADEITDLTSDRLLRKTFDFGRINFANGDMVGHTGNLEATVVALETVDLMIGRLRRAVEEVGGVLIVTADHGNADEMFDAKEKDYPDWENLSVRNRPTPKTSHTLNPVPFVIYDAASPKAWKLRPDVETRGLGHVANTCLTLMGIPNRDIYLPSLIARN